MSDWTPKTDVVRECFVDEWRYSHRTSLTDKQLGEAFDRWLDGHDQELRAQIAKDVEAVIDTSPWYVRLRYGLLEAVKIIRGGDQR